MIRVRTVYDFESIQITVSCKRGEMTGFLTLAEARKTIDEIRREMRRVAKWARAARARKYARKGGRKKIPMAPASTTRIRAARSRGAA